MAEKRRLTDEQIARRIDGAPRLASLRSVGTALSELVYAENSFTSQIADVIRRDPSLTSRLLKLVNSVFFGLSQRVNNIEEAIFYLGLRQIRELALATPIIEDFEQLHKGYRQADWRKMWLHSIGTGILTREVLATANVTYDDDTDYIVGLVHNVGKIVMASVFPEDFEGLLQQEAATTEEFANIERETVGWDHARVGSYYLQHHQISPEIVEAIAYHNLPQNAPIHSRTAAAVQIADHMARAAGIEGLENTAPVSETHWTRLPGWTILFGTQKEEQDTALTNLRHSLRRLPAILKGMV